MNETRKLISALPGLLALVALGLGLAWLLGPQGVLPVQKVSPAQQVSPVQTPTPGLVETRTPEEIILITPPPTYVPPPTPTPHPWPETTPFPIPDPAEDPSGTILYMTITYTGTYAYPRQCTVHAIQVDKAGQPTGDPKAIANIENCGELFASPDSHYLVISQGCGDAGVHPIILDIKTLQMWPLFGSDCAAFGLFHDWHPDSRHVLFGVDGFSPDFKFAEDQSWRDAGLWLVDIETGDYSVLAGERISGGAAVSPDGARVVYGGGGEAWVVSLDGAKRERLDAPVGYLHGWSPDGEWILSTGGGVYATNVLDGRHVQLDPDIIVLKDDSLSPLPGKVIGTNMLTAWSPDGRTVAATQVLVPKGAGADFNPFEAGNIYLMDADGGRKWTLLSEGHGLSAAWSPDGSMLAFLSDRNGSTEVWIVNADGTDLQQLTYEGPTRQFMPYYAPIWISSRR
jgi:hypothetical protein